MTNQEKYKQLLEEHRWLTKSIWDKINSAVTANGILFAALNLIEVQGSKNNFIIHKIGLSVAGVLITLFFWLALNLDLKHRQNNLQSIYQIQKVSDDLSINLIDAHYIIRLVKFEFEFDTTKTVKFATGILLILWLVLILFILIENKN
ncbi:Uncharacterised protein [uncultured archaeon]|nr:Uncharacterised protein [uncultured archaeon]